MSRPQGAPYLRSGSWPWGRPHLVRHCEVGPRVEEAGEVGEEDFNRGGDPERVAGHQTPGAGPDLVLTTEVLGQGHSDIPRHVR